METKNVFQLLGKQDFARCCHNHGAALPCPGAERWRCRLYMDGDTAQGADIAFEGHVCDSSFQQQHGSLF